jgi:hypothetical protein
VLHLVGEPLEHLVRLRLDAAEGEMDAVAALVEQPEDRRQRAHRSRVPHDEEELHRNLRVPLRSPG